jgi:hypothetical protein
MFAVDLTSAAYRAAIGPSMIFLIEICMRDGSIKKDLHPKDEIILQTAAIF